MAAVPGYASQQNHLPARVVGLLVIAATILSLSMGLRQSLGLFLPPLNTELAISASTFGFAMALQNIVWGVGQPIVGMFGDRYGARPVLVATACLYALGLALMGFSGNRFGLDAGLGVMVGLGIAGTSFGVLIGAVSRVVPPARRNQLVGTRSRRGIARDTRTGPAWAASYRPFWLEHRLIRICRLRVFDGRACPIHPP